MIKADTRKLKVNYFNLLTIGGWGGGRGGGQYSMMRPRLGILAIISTRFFTKFVTYLRISLYLFSRSFGRSYTER